MIDVSLATGAVLVARVMGKGEVMIIVAMEMVMMVAMAM